jgi:AbrB family looped-hinge helix DNA binding protein
MLMSALERIPPATFEGKLNAEGRVVVPAAIRRLLGVTSGDRLLFVADAEGVVRLTSARILVDTVWANNRGGDAVDAGEYVRHMRDEDRRHEVEQAEASRRDAIDDRSDAEVGDDLFANLDLL